MLGGGGGRSVSGRVGGSVGGMVLALEFEEASGVAWVVQGDEASAVG
jgi:hypothetical protein